MKLPGLSPHNQTDSKFSSFDNTNTGHKPTSVVQQNLDHWDDLLPHNFDLDSLAKELDLKIADSDLFDRRFDSAIADFSFPGNHQAFESRCFDDLNLHDDDWGYSGSDFVDDLIRVADCVNANDSQLDKATLVPLGKRLPSPVGKPLGRAAFYFHEALNRVTLTESARVTERIPSWSEIVQTIQAHNAFARISPIPMFSHFSANQIIIDSLISSPPAKSLASVHVVDFDIGFGSQYASLMREITEKSNFDAVQSLRITAVVSDEYAAAELRLVRETLIQFAQAFKIRFQIQFVPFQNFEMFSFQAIDFAESEGTAVLLSPTVLRHLNRTPSFARDLRRASPNGVVVVVVTEGDISTGSCQTASLKEEFVNILEFYALTLESLDMAAAGGGGSELMAAAARRIETVLVRRKIFNAVEASVRKKRVGLTWREVLYGAGMRPVSPSRMADFQAEFLLEMVPVTGFHVVKRQAELVLCWHNKPLVATSAWRC